MKLVFIDYSPLYYKTIAKKTMPSKRTGKFVQIRDGEKEYLVLSPKDLSTYHANVVERFCTEQGIAGSYNTKRDHYTVSSPNWEVVGGGVWTVDVKEKSLHLTGSSLAYGRYDRRGLQDRLASVRELAAYSVIVE